MMMDWDSDPELKAIREAFVASFAERRDQLKMTAEKLAHSRKSNQEEFMVHCEAARFVAHKLAGAAESYGFPGITEAASALDDWLSHAPEQDRRDAQRVSGYLTLLVEVLEEALVHRQDPARFRGDARFKELFAAVQVVRATI